ncbi:hypothetical protein [Paludibacterium paludis]|uniref:hypothetical protein n=1 Tax=Paludibacterium paludis TaxID=1225769 RepID=UPI00167A9449|nr:hypothetical protein [Paludibacterium paludis]
MSVVLIAGAAQGASRPPCLGRIKKAAIDADRDRWPPKFPVEGQFISFARLQREAMLRRRGGVAILPRVNP